MRVRPRALMRVFVCANARVYVYVQVYVREIVCSVLASVRVHTHVRACRGMQGVSVTRERVRAC